MSAPLLGDTIFALSTGIGRSAIAIVRVSGPACAEILRSVCPGTAFKDRHATLAALFDAGGELLDQGLVVRFVEPKSFTGEDMIEFQVTGSRAVTAGLKRMLAGIPDVRPAEPGEFAWRAFLRGKLDLVQVEGLASVVEAETRAQLRHAVLTASGGISRQLESVNATLLKVIAIVESMLDFSDVEDASFLEMNEVVIGVTSAREAVARLLENSETIERLRDGFVVAIAGPPNAGKSTLLNCLAKREVAIVSEIPGTTRDLLEVQAEIGGYPVVFVDTAGIRETSDPIERLGVDKARRKFATADLVLWLDENVLSMPDQAANGASLVRVATKSDVHKARPEHGLRISAATGAGIGALIDKIEEFAERHFSGAGQPTFGTERQRAAANDAVRALDQIIMAPSSPLELIAEDLRTAASAIGRIVGRIEVEEVLGEIFSRLCVGK